MPNGIIIIDKPEGWTSMDVCPSPKIDGAIFGEPLAMIKNPRRK